MYNVTGDLNHWYYRLHMLIISLTSQLNNVHSQVTSITKCNSDFKVNSAKSCKFYVNSVQIVCCGCVAVNYLKATVSAVTKLNHFIEYFRVQIKLRIQTSWPYSKCTVNLSWNLIGQNENGQWLLLCTLLFDFKTNRNRITR